MSTYRCVGVMSGTSLDGLDVCCVEFTGDVTADVWSHRLLAGVTYPYTADWAGRLGTAPALGGLELARLHVDYGHLLGSTVRRFIDESRLDDVNLVASHGHTVFHQPQRQLTFQLGDGETIASYVRCPVVSNFRAKDVALGGQGAPLVSLGEAYLFSGYDVLLNLGGIANVSIVTAGGDGAAANQRGASGCVAFDVCPCNMLLNCLAQRLPGSAGVQWDEGGTTAASGAVLDDVLRRLNELAFYARPPPKSLGREWLEQNVLPIVDDQSYSVRDLLRTSVEHIALQVARAVSTHVATNCCPGQGEAEAGADLRRAGRGPVRLLATGGGFHNTFLLGRVCSALDEAVPGGVVVERRCDRATVDLKEALVFAFLGLRCLLGLVNVDSTVTGAALDTVSGSIHLGVDRAARRAAVFSDDMPANLRKSSNALAQRDSSSSAALPLPHGAGQLRRTRSAAAACVHCRAQQSAVDVEQNA